MFGELLLHQRNEQIAHLWAAALEQHKPALFLAQEDVDEIKAFGAQLGDLDCDAQLDSIAMLTNYINERVVHLNLGRDKNKKLFQSLGLLGGALIVIIFV